MRLMARMFFAVACLLPGLAVCVGNTAGQENQVYTLEQSISEALDRNWTLKSEEERLVQAIDIKNQRRADFLFKLKTDYGYTRLDQTPTSTSVFDREIITGDKNNYQWQGSATQPVFTGFALFSAYRLAKLGIDRAKIDIEIKKLDLALGVKEAYFNVLIVDKAVDVAQKEVESLSSNFAVTQSFYKAGLVPINDLLKAEMELANARNNLVQAQNAAKLSRSQFNTLLARPIGTPVEVEDILVQKEEKIVFEEMTDEALAGRPEMRLIDNAILQSGQQVWLAASGLFPEITLNYRYIKEGDEASVAGSDYHDADRWETMAVCSLSLWEWGKTYYAVKEKKSLKRELMITRNAVKDNIVLEVKDAVLNLETALENIPTTQKAVLQGEENLRVNEEGYKAQMSTITDVLDAQALLTRARVNYYKALYTHNLARANLLRAVGTY